MRDATDKSVHSDEAASKAASEAASERNKVRTVLLKKRQEERVLLNWLNFSALLSSGCQPGGEHDVVGPAN